MASDAFVKLGFTYYDDVVLASLDDAAEVMFTRAIAYSGRSGSKGFIPERKVLELTRKTSLKAALRIADSLCAQVNGFQGPLEKTKGGYRIRNFGHYQDQLEAIQQRRQNDRERKARERAASRDTPLDTSRDMSRDSHANVTPTSKRKKKRKRETDKSVSQSDPDFDTFWAAYPRKVGKGQARKAWTKATSIEDAPVIIQAALDFAEWCDKEQTEPRYIAHPSTWLNGERWTDERPAHQPAQTNIDKHLALVRELEADEQRQIGPA